ncbi:MAG: hypothetical protein ACODAD_11590 [Planctomycetota bacterium]
MAAISGTGCVLVWGQSWWKGVVAFLALVGVHISFVGSLHGYTPESSEVRRMATAAMDYLEENGKTQEGAILGGEALVGLAAYKYNRRFGSDPRALPRLTQGALERAVREVDQGQGASSRNYTLGIVLMLLSEVHPQRHMPTIEAYLDELLQRQKPHGGWGYQSDPGGGASRTGPSYEQAGDLSQLQYAVLGLWSAQSAGLEVPNQSMVDVVNYVIRVQDPSGGWGYQGVDPGSYTRVSQPAGSIKRARTAAGLGSLYVGADFLGVTNTQKTGLTSRDGLPPALVPVREQEERRSDQASGGVPMNYWKRAIEDGHRWFSRTSLSTGKHQYYHLYGMERLYSFKEKLEGSEEPEPAWYNEGVRILRERQDDDGSWGLGPGDITCCSSPVATAFGVLFLVRGTQLTVARGVDLDGVLQGGRGLPSDMGAARVRGSRIVSPAITGEVDDLITMLEDEEGEKIERLLENPGTLSLRGLKEGGPAHTTRLARIVRAGQSYKARVVAARTLGRQEELDNVPVLIHALTDPDPRVVRAARDALRLTSRKVGGFGLSDEPSSNELSSVIEKWKRWYQSVRPDAVFLNSD